MIDQEFVTRKLVLISADLTALDEMARTPLAEYLSALDGHKLDNITANGRVSFCAVGEM